MKNKFYITPILLTLLSIIMVACGGKDDIKRVVVKNVVTQQTNENNKRWYNTAQLMRGRKVFKNNCAVCHGDKGQGLVADWKKAQPDGKFPAPPLNGSAHTWHHSKELLMRTVNNGGIPLGGSMPSFKDKLSEKEKEAVLAHIMSLWPDQIYASWAQRNLK